MSSTIEISRVDHIGIRVKDLDRALAFYTVLGFSLAHRAADDAVAIVKNPNGVELNLVFNASHDANGKNVLMDVPEKYAGITHVALRVTSIKSTVEALNANQVRITQGPVEFGGSGEVSVFVRDPDLNVIELRGRKEQLAPGDGVKPYVPEN